MAGLAYRKRFRGIRGNQGPENREKFRENWGKRGSENCATLTQHLALVSKKMTRDTQELVEKVEAMCDALEEWSPTLLEGLGRDDYATSKRRIVSLPATIANVKLYYFVEHVNKTKSGFEKLLFLLTDGKSGWKNLSEGDKIALVRKNVDVVEEVLVLGL